MLDGAVWRGEGRNALLRHAGMALRAGKTDPNHLPMALLRETLDGIPAVAAFPVVSRSMAGAAPVGPHHARIWWDRRVLDSLGDVLSLLENPRLVLRFYDVTGLDPEAGRWHETFDIDVALSDAGRTVQFWSCDRTYVVDLGYVHDGNRFLRLARTNVIDLPRDGKSAAGSDATAVSRLRPAGDRNAAYTAPDAAAKAWAEARPDHEGRDWEAELVVHMLYRAFLAEGPRALRRAPALVRRDGAALREEFARRQYRRGAAAEQGARGEPAFLVARLDAPPAPVPGSTAKAAVSRPVAAVHATVHAGVAAGAAMDAAEFARYALLLRAVRAEAETAAVRVATERMETHIRVAGADVPAAMFATPVFEAARNLRESLAGLRDMEQEVPSAEAVSAAQLFDAAEAKRLAKAGVRVSRMSLTLEGRIRPGARLKVAGKLVHADAEGNFRLECILSGRRTAIPMRAGTSISGEARSLISIDWSKRSNEKLAEA